MEIIIEGVYIKTYVTRWLDDINQIRVISVSPREYIIKARRELTLEEAKGAIVKYEMEQRNKLTSGE
jgi:hypothetical protein